VPDYDLLQSGLVDPMQRVIIAVIFGVIPEVLIDGIITHQQFDPGSQPGQASLTITGRDLTALMDIEEKNASFPNQPDFAIAARVLKEYATYGIVPAPTPTTDFPICLERIPRQQETDLQFLQRLAERNGFVFYVQPMAPGVSQAYFGPENRLGLPQSALSVNLGAATNTKSVQFTNDGLAKVTTRGVMVEPLTKSNIPLPNMPSLRLPPLAATPAPGRIRLERNTAKQSPATAATTAQAQATNAVEPTTAEGEIDTARYGRVLRALALVGMRGVGLSYDGFWYVRRVTHTLVPRGHYSQRFQLSRDGTGSLTPIVKP
jgi:hypothetical protein